ncbi:MAG: 2-C-methyl-D-erythritol 2,4-cyclodiphosphate synthase [Candidatus Eremiobacteraeota bacterium]|nr:2-C-methyl-D-erythritol 2,4-cyclodiphosphate synthase [Candidatus Eremiobacteraeota bacterium]
MLGGIAVDCEFGAVGHSDADVLAHAISDALLGACALGDLGMHFPDTDSRYRGADSMQLLQACAALVKSHGFSLGNVDATVIVEHPKLAPYVERMRERIAEVLDLEPQYVSVKVKSSEGMGYTGDGTGIAAQALACVTS